MAIKNTLFGGSLNWSEGNLGLPADFNDTFGAIGTIIINGTTALTVPIGTVVLWHKSLTGIPSLPGGWAECDGSTISDADSPMNGQALPSLLSTRLYLRGNTTSGGTGGTTTHSHTTSSAGTDSAYSPSPIAYNAVGNPNAGTDTQNHEPPYITMTPIMRVK